MKRRSDRCTIVAHALIDLQQKARAYASVGDRNATIDLVTAAENYVKTIENTMRAKAK